jgi:hypothetical protein
MYLDPRFGTVTPWPIVIWFGAAALLARIALAFAAPHFPVDLAQPLPVATNWGIYGAAVCAALAVAVLGSLRSYVRALAVPPHLSVTLAIAALTLLVSSLWSPLLSSDVYAYAAYGEMARLHLDPYVHHALQSDAIVRAAAWQWSGSLPICVYGEAFVALARAAVTLFHGAATIVVLSAFRVLASLSLLACGACAYVVAGGAERGERAAAFITLNPVVLYVALEGHNDLLMLACALAGVALAIRRPFGGAALAAAAGAIKAPALAAGIAVAAEHILRRRAPLAAFAGMCAGAALAILASLRLIKSVSTTLVPHGMYQPYASVQSLSPIVAAALAVAIVAKLARTQSPMDRWTLIALIAWLAIPNPYAWYASWLIAVAAFARSPAVVATTLAVSVASILRYLPDAAGIPTPFAAFSLALVALLAYLPLVLQRAP